MRAIWKLTIIEIKLFLREPMAVFFTLIFPLIMLFLFGSIYGNAANPMFHGGGYVDTYSIPAFTALIIATSGLLSLPIQVSAYREKGIFRRLQATPLRPQAILLAQSVSLLLMTALGIFFLVLAGKWFFHVKFSGSLPKFLFAFVLSCLSIFSLGFLLASFFATARIAQIAAMAVFYPIIFLSGATIPLEILPASFRQANQFLPLTHVVTLLRGLWAGDPLGIHLKELLILTILMIIAAAISGKTFRWD